MAAEGGVRAIDASALDSGPVVKSLKDIDPGAQQPAVVEQEPVLHVESKLRREGARAMAFLRGTQAIVLPGRDHLVQHQRDVLPLEIFDRRAPLGCAEHRLRIIGVFDWQAGGVDTIAVRGDHGALEHVSKLAHIAGPWMRFQAFLGIR